VPTLWGKPWTILKTSHWLSDAIRVKQDDLILKHELIFLIYFFSISHRLSVVGLRPSSSLSRLAQDGLAECDQPGKNPLKYSAVAGN